MDFFKKNPFLGVLVSVCVVLLLGGGFLIFSEAGRLGEEQSTFEQKTMELQRLQRNKPYPNKANVEATAREEEEARALVGQIAKNFAVEIPNATPEAFQDELAKLVKDIAEKAAAKGVVLPENFYLGFEQYETQLPSAKAAPTLARQLRTIHAVVALLIDANVKSLGLVVRAPILAEKNAEDTEASAKTRKQDKPAAPGVEIAPFDVSFSSDQSAFRLAFNRILEIDPPVFLRLLAVENSAPSPPSKAGDAAAASPEPAAAQEAGTPAQTAGIKPVVGRETVNVNLRLASVVSSGP